MKIILIVVFHLTGCPDSQQELRFDMSEHDMAWCEDVSAQAVDAIPDNITIVMSECVEM